MGIPKHDFGYNYGPVAIPDPGDAGVIRMRDAMFAACGLVTAGTETRTLLAPSTVGQKLILYCDTDGGQATITINNGVQLPSDTVLSGAGNAIFLEAISLAGVPTWRRVGGPDFCITHTMLLNADCIDQMVFLADRAYEIVGITEIHAVAGNDAGAVNMQVTKDTGTDAPGAGTNLLTNNTNAGFDMKGTANTLQTGDLVTTAGALNLAAGNRLSVDFAGTVTTLAGVMVTVVLRPLN
jgi:hypothetical protein